MCRGYPDQAVTDYKRAKWAHRLNRWLFRAGESGVQTGDEHGRAVTEELLQ
jgi:hypothetical protein